MLRPLTGKADGEQWKAQAANTLNPLTEPGIKKTLCTSSVTHGKYSAPSIKSILAKKLNMNLIVHLALISSLAEM